MDTALTVSGTERHFERDEIIVSKTDLKGRITYANHVFWRISGYAEKELIGQPHSILRHEAMPRCVFKLLWDTIEAGSEIFAYVLNRCKNGDYYWVLAHVTPSRNPAGELVGYHSNRRVVDPDVIRKTVAPLYTDLVGIERGHANRKEGMAAGYEAMTEAVKKSGMAYDEFVWSLR